MRLLHNKNVCVPEISNLLLNVYVYNAHVTKINPILGTHHKKSF